MWFVKLMIYLLITRLWIVAILLCLPLVEIYPFKYIYILIDLIINPKQYLEENCELNSREVIKEGRIVTAEDATTMYLCYRGTQIEAEDFLRDIDIRKTEIYGGYVHKGFLDRSKEYDYEAFYQEAVKKCKSVIICGHSLGGAAAILATLALFDNHFDQSTKIKCLTYGAPFCLSRDVINYFTNRDIDRYFLCFVNNYDMIPQSVNIVKKKTTGILQTIAAAFSPQTNTDFTNTALIEFQVHKFIPNFYPFGNYLFVDSIECHSIDDIKYKLSKCQTVNDIMKYYMLTEDTIKTGKLTDHFFVCYFLAVMLNSLIQVL